MAKQHYHEVSDKDKQKFAKFLSEDEELILATGFGSTHLRQRFIIQTILPGGIFILGGLVFAYFYPLNLGLGLLIGLILALVFSGLRTWHIYHANRYLLTTRRVILKRGLFAVKLMSALYDKITHIEVDQSFIEKLLMHHGTITVHTAGGQQDEIILRYVDHPIELKNLLERLINSERQRFGLKREVLQPIEGEEIKD